MWRDDTLGTTKGGTLLEEQVASLTLGPAHGAGPLLQEQQQLDGNP